MVKQSKTFADMTADTEHDLSVDLGDLRAAWEIGGRDYLPYKLSLVAKLLDRCTTRLLSESCGLTVAEWRVLAQLALESPLSARRLAEQAFVDPAEVSRAAASLLRKNYIQRRRNPGDKRSALLSCTEEGRALFERIRPLRTQFHKSLTDQIPPEDVEKVENALALFARSCQVRLKTDGGD